MYNYILVRVEEPDDDIKSKMFATRAVLVRKAIHEFAQRNNITVADDLIRSDRTKTPWGIPISLAEVEELFDKIMYRGSL
jgi:hypothetical protein